ncbi:MAG: sugar transferase [Deltaproteobacteria bacterium]|nr:MAG: sugar transferase [Deltaproteobacteria bacterium]
MAKRSFDIVVSLVLLVLLSPVLLYIAIRIKCESPGPVFYRGVRTGLHGKPFRILKFRTMVPDAEHLGGPSTAYNDPRLTKFGASLRKYKLDELPQFINVLLGDMSIVGPRPQVERYTMLYNNEEKIILSVKPGITDYASLHFINLDRILGDHDVDGKYLREIEPEKNRLRVKYAREHSFLVDVKILLLTARKMLNIVSARNAEE